MEMCTDWAGNNLFFAQKPAGFKLKAKEKLVCLLWESSEKKALKKVYDYNHLFLFQ